MDLATATARVEIYARTDEEPTLTPAEVSVLLDDNARDVDSAGVLPSGAGWVPTYSRGGVFKAVAEAWRLKAGRLAGTFDFTTDGQQFRRAQKLDHCIRLETLYRRKAHSAPELGV